MHEKPTSLETYVSVPRGVGTADTTTLSNNQMCIQVRVSYSFMSQLVLHMHQTTFNKSADTDHGFFHCHYHGWWEREGKKKEKKKEKRKKEEEAKNKPKSNLFEGISFPLIFWPP